MMNDIAMDELDEFYSTKTTQSCRWTKNFKVKNTILVGTAGVASRYLKLYDLTPISELKFYNHKLTNAEIPDNIIVESQVVDNSKVIAGNLERLELNEMDMEDVSVDGGRVIMYESSSTGMNILLIGDLVNELQNNLTSKEIVGFKSQVSVLDIKQDLTCDAGGVIVHPGNRYAILTGLPASLITFGSYIEVKVLVYQIVQGESIVADVKTALNLICARASRNANPVSDITSTIGSISCSESRIHGVLYAPSSASSLYF